MIGRTVFHRFYGEGTVVGTAHRGFSLRVQFEGFVRWVMKREVEWIGGPEPGPATIRNLGLPVRPQDQGSAEAGGPAEAGAEPPDPHGGMDAFRSRRIVEALRLGVTPVDEVPRLTFGRQAEISKIEGWLNESAAGTLLAAGDYGSGKTHLLRWAYAYGLENGWAVALVDVDPYEAPFHKPKRLYRYIVSSLRYRDPDTGRVDRFRKLLEKSLARKPMHDHCYFKNAEPTSSESIWLWLQGFESIRPYEFVAEGGGYFGFNRYRFVKPMYDYTTAANIYCYLLSGLSWASTNIGLKGLIICFDEAESVDSWNYSYQLDRGLNFLAALQLTAANSKALVGHPRFSQLNYCRKPGVDDIPFIYRIPTALKLFFALTPPSLRDLEQRLGDFRNLDRVSVQPLDRSVFEPLFRMVTDIYSKAYGWSPDGRLRDLLESALSKLGRDEVSTRRLVKAQVEALDLLRLGRRDKAR